MREHERTLAGTTVYFSDPPGGPNVDLAWEGGLVALQGSVDDLSKGGFHVSYLDRPPPASFTPGHTVSFRFQIPTGGVQGTAVIEWVRTDPAQIGLRFLDLSPEGRDVLMRYLTGPFLGPEQPG